MALPPSTANWHWKNKGVTGWGKEWFETNLTTVIFTEGESTVGVQAVTGFEGDVEMGMRKSKLLTIYDCNLTLKWVGTASDGSEVEGTLNIPEVSHEITLDGDGDYQFNFTLTTSPATPAVTSLYELTRKQLPPLLKAKFAEFPDALVEVHGRDLKVTGSGTATPNGTSTPTVSAPTPVPVQPTTTTATKKAQLNFSTVKVDANFMVSAEDMFDLLTDDSRIPAWTRASAKSKPVVDSEFEMFGGNITGKYVSITRPSKIVQSWVLRSPTWPSGHSGTLTTTINQQSDSTKVLWELAGVPTGQEEEITNNLRGYYIRGFQSIGCVLVSETPSYDYSPKGTISSPPQLQTSSPENNQLPLKWLLVGSIAGSVLLASIGARFLS